MRARGAWSPAVLSGLFVFAMFAAVIAVRWRSHYSNVDDYLYALQTRAYLDAVGFHLSPLVHAWEAYGSNSPLVPMLALPIAAIDGSPKYLVLVQAVPLLVILVSVRSLLRDLGSGRRAAWLAAALVTALPPVLGYAAMYHFAVAATACATLAVAAYARSQRLLSRPPTLVLGLALGLLSVARVIAPIYIVALCVPMAVDVLVEARDRRVRARNGILALVVAGVIAAPWWLAAGGTAVHYLTSVGYGHQGLAKGGSGLDVELHRLTWTASESGWLLAVLVGILIVWSSACVIRRAAGWRLAAVLIGSSLLGLALLGTSRNEGTAFALPFVVLLSCGAVWGIERMTPRLRGVVASCCVASLVVPALALMDVAGPARVAGRELWQVGTPGLAQARSALGCDCAPPDTDALSDRVLRVVGDRPFLVLRADALLNVNSLRYSAQRQGSVAKLLVPAAGRPLTARQLSEVDYVVTGATPRPYPPAVNELSAFVQLRAARFRPVLSRLLSRGNSVLMWAAPRVHAARPRE